jgi:tRNA pseudouridine38-40 synthase
MGSLRNIVLKVAYDGTAYKGWQNSKSLPSIEATLQSALEKILKLGGKLQAASRTDAGVHAHGQLVNFFSDTYMPLKGIKMRLNGILPPDISILDIQEASFDFHPTLDCSSKEYHYFVCNSQIQMPQNRLYSWHFPYKLKIDDMNQAAKVLTGSLNFEAFCNVRKNHVYDDYIREVMSIDILILPEQRICFKIKGNKFLYKMVRNIVGTILSVGSEKMSIEALSKALNSQNRTQIGMTAKAHGLTLFQVNHKLMES